MREDALTCTGAQAGGGDEPAPRSSSTEGATHPGHSSHSESSRVPLRGRPCRVLLVSNHPTRGPERAPVGAGAQGGAQHSVMVKLRMVRRQSRGGQGVSPLSGKDMTLMPTGRTIAEPLTRRGRWGSVWESFSHPGFRVQRRRGRADKGTRWDSGQARGKMGGVKGGRGWTSLNAQAPRLGFPGQDPQCILARRCPCRGGPRRHS